MEESQRLRLRTLARLKNTRWLLLIATILAFGAGFGISYVVVSDTSSSDFDVAFVARVIDGDTIELADGQRVRYLGIDTPELGEPYSYDALALNQELVEGKWVELQVGNEDRDQYGRLLRYVYVDGVFVNAQLVAQGYATTMIFDPTNKYSQVLVQLEQYAKVMGRGMWQGGL